MSYNTGNLSLFNQSSFTASTFVYAQAIVPQITPLGRAQLTNVYINYFAPSLIGRGVSNFSGLAVALNMNAAQVSVTSLYSVFLQTPTVTALAGANVKAIYDLYVTAPSVISPGTITNNYTAYIGGMTGIGTTTPQNMLDISGSMTIGTYAGVITAPSNTVLVSNSVGLGTSNPQFALDSQGAIGALQVLAPGTMVNRQKQVLSLGYNQGGFGGGAIGSNQPFNSISFDTSVVSSLSGGFAACMFDGRYLYFADNFSGTIGWIRYDSFSNFSNSSSWTFCDLNSLGLSTWINTCGFDGRFAYLGLSSLVRYDTALSFVDINSYTIATSISSLPAGCTFVGSVFDGRYLYFPLGSGVAQLLRYDTESDFSSSTSWVIFDYATAFSLTFPAAEPGQVAFDGRYVYVIPMGDNVEAGPATYQGHILLRYDVTMSFLGSGSYTTFDTFNMSSPVVGMEGVVFNGRFLYLSGAGNRFLGQYDLTLPFTSTASYLTGNFGAHWSGIGCDNRYVYIGQSWFFSPPNRKDSASSFFDSMTELPGGIHAMGGIFDGAFLYLPAALGSVIYRAAAYPGPSVVPLSIGYSIGDFTITGNLQFSVNIASTATSGASGAMPSLASGFVQININGTLYRVPYF